jgi:hypothetical protein
MALAISTTSPVVVSSGRSGGDAFISPSANLSTVESPSPLSLSNNSAFTFSKNKPLSMNLLLPFSYLSNLHITSLYAIATV